MNIVIEKSASDGVATEDEFVRGVGDVPDWGWKTPVESLVERGSIEVDGGVVFSFAGEDLQKAALLELDLIECEDSGLVVVGKSCVDVFNGVYEEKIVDGVDVFFSTEGYTFPIVVAGMVDSYEAEGKILYGFKERCYIFIFEVKWNEIHGI